MIYKKYMFYITVILIPHINIVYSNNVTNNTIQGYIKTSQKANTCNHCSTNDNKVCMDDQCQCAADYYQDDDDDDFDCEFDYCYKDSKCQVNGDSNRVCKSRYCLCKTGYAADANNGQKCIKSTAISTTAIISTTAWPPFTWPWDDEYTTKGSYNNGVPFWSWGWVFIALPIIVCSIVGICVNHKRKLRRLQNHMVILRPQPAQVQGQGQSQGQVPYMSQAVYPNQY